ncbi:MAG: hypothetical protein JWO43_338 [Candidatus Adlerbacteria bacterium]|nr:hypothetical protein [Candidatus Adlerbacteria bacterium]
MVGSVRHYDSESDTQITEGKLPRASQIEMLLEALGKDFPGAVVEIVGSGPIGEVRKIWTSRQDSKLKIDIGPYKLTVDNPEHQSVIVTLSQWARSNMQHAQVRKR